MLNHWLNHRVERPLRKDKVKTVTMGIGRRQFNLFLPSWATRTRRLLLYCGVTQSVCLYQGRRNLAFYNLHWSVGKIKMAEDHECELWAGLGIYPSSLGEGFGKLLKFKVKECTLVHFCSTYERFSVDLARKLAPGSPNSSSESWLPIPSQRSGERSRW